MAHDELKVLAPHELCRFARNEQVAGAVEAVLTNFIVLIVLVRNRVHVRVIGHGRMERRVEHGNLRRVRHSLHARLDTHNVCRHMERTEVDVAFDKFKRFVVDTCAFFKNNAAVEHSVTDRRYFLHV